MPLGFERLNERRKRPNELINFIKPLPSPDEDLARDFLERVAAVCYPVMKANHIAVMALEEHEPNREFVGRNFNAGEVIQLVLKAPFTGQWLPFRHVQMVMMHELAHCKQMNHSRAFWKVRDQYAGELRELWAKRYTGEGLWGRGQTVLSGRYETNVMPEAVQEIDRLCGGTFRSRGRKRKRGSDKPQLSYAERKQRRILKKFGKGGVALGDDEATRSQLEAGKQVKSKPRVAGSARGRELRAAAALARFDKAKTEEEDVKIKQEPDYDSGSETESEDEGYATAEVAIDTDGKKMTDSRGRPLVSVCGSEDPADDDVKREMRELFEYGFSTSKPVPVTESSSSRDPDGAGLGIKEEQDQDTSNPMRSVTQRPERPISNKTTPAVTPSTPTAPHPIPPPSKPPAESLTCAICSLDNPPNTLVCKACSHVLDEDLIIGCWRCHGPSCNSGYLNAGDVGRCGLCGAAKPFAMS